MKRSLLAFSVLLATAALVLPIAAQDRAREFHLVEATIADIQEAYRSDLPEPAQLVRMYQARIAPYDSDGPQLNSFMHVSEHAIDDALALDDDGETHDHDRVNKPLWGIPIILKDNIDTADMPTTAGSVALGGSTPPDDAFIVQ